VAGLVLGNNFQEGHYARKGIGHDIDEWYRACSHLRNRQYSRDGTAGLSALYHQ